MERCAQFETADKSFSLYKHCHRAIEKGAMAGAHGLSLMESGDWNDGMNPVGMDAARRERLARLVSARHAQVLCAIGGVDE